MRISDWSSDVCSSDLVARDAREDRWLDIIAAIDVCGQAGAAGFERRAFVDRRLNQALDLVELRLVDDGADVAAFALRIAHRGAIEHRLDDADSFGLAFLLDGEDRKSTRLNSSP